MAGLFDAAEESAKARLVSRGWMEKPGHCWQDPTGRIWKEAEALRWLAKAETEEKWK